MRQATSRWRFLPLVVAIGLLLPGCPEREARPRLLLIGIDGGSWNLIDPLLEAGELPQLASLLERGASAELDSVEPLISPAAWTSLATGRRPEVHGIASFFASRRAIRVPTLWDRFAARGLKVGLYDYLLTWPPRPLPGGFMIPGWLRRDGRTWPPDLFARLGVAGYCYQVVDVGGLEDVVASIERELEEKPRTWNRLAEAFEPDFGAVTFYALDVASHRFYHTAFPEEFDPPIDRPASGDVLRRTLRGIDRAVGDIVVALDPDDHVVIVSDHGFQASPQVFRHWGFAAAWLLEKAAIDRDRDGVAVVNGFMNLILGVALEPGPGTPEREAALRRLEDFFAGLRTADGDPIFRLQIVREPEKALADEYPEWMVDVMRHRPGVGAFFFASPIPETFDRLWPDGLVEVGEERFPLHVFTSPHVFTGDHHRTGIFIAAGRAIRHRAERPRRSVLDVAPLLSYLAGQPIPDDLEGILDEGLIEPGYLRRHPPRRVAASEVPGLPEEGDLEGPEGAGDEEIKQRLRALGYLQTSLIQRPLTVED